MNRNYGSYGSNGEIFTIRIYFQINLFYYFTINFMVFFLFIVFPIEFSLKQVYMKFICITEYLCFITK